LKACEKIVCAGRTKSGVSEASGLHSSSPDIHSHELAAKSNLIVTWNVSLGEHIGKLVLWCNLIELDDATFHLFADVNESRVSWVGLLAILMQAVVVFHYWGSLFVADACIPKTNN
jgi:hypothetical protein